MAYFAPYIDEYGPHIPSYNDIMEYLIGDPDNLESNPGLFRQIYGTDIYLESDSQDYQFLSSLALLYYDCCQSFLLAYNNQSPTTAIGVSLDRLAAINGVVRKSATYSIATLLLTGTPNTTISYVQAKDLNGYIWQIARNVTFDANGEATTTAACVTPGNIQAPSNTITIIATPTQNWLSVTNPAAAIPGSDIEEDSVLRERRHQSVNIHSTTTFDSVISYLRSLSVVRRVNGYENDTNLTVGGIPGHSIAIVVEADDSDETRQTIANAIYLQKTPGTGTYGSISVDVESSMGLTNTIKFSYPTEVVANVVIDLTTLSGYTSGIDDKIKESVIEYINSLNIGEDLYVSNLYLPVLSNNGSSTPYFYVNSITVNSMSSVVSVGNFEVMNTSSEYITINR